MSNNNRVELIEDLIALLVSNADHYSKYGRNLLKQATLDLAERALQSLLTDVIVS